MGVDLVTGCCDDEGHGFLTHTARLATDDGRRGDVRVGDEDRMLTYDKLDVETVAAPPS